MSIKAALVKELREKTGLGVIDCKHALEETKEDITLAIEYLYKKGAMTAEKKKNRETKAGLVWAYVHHGNKIGVLIEIECETDFVAKNEEMIGFAKDMAMQVAAARSLYICKEIVPTSVIEEKKEIYKKQIDVDNKPSKVIEKIIEGKLEKFYEEICLLEQPFIKDPNIKVKDILLQKIAKFGENIKIGRFVRYEIGEK